MIRLFSLFLSFFVVTAASAQGNAEQDAQINACRAIPSDSERLECYDRALDAAYGVSKELEEKRAEYRRARFGLPLDSNGMEITELTATIANVDENLRTNKTLFTLENGQVWELLSSGGLRTRLKPGMEVSISESGTGGYRLRVPDKSGFKGVNRLR